MTEGLGGDLTVDPAPPPPHRRGPDGEAPPRPPGSLPAPPGPGVGEGALRFSHSGERYLLGYGAEYFGIWDRNSPGRAIATFPRTDDGWPEAWNRFTAMEPRCVAVPRAGSAPDVRRSLPPAYRSGHALANWVVALLALYVLATLVLLAFTISEVGLLQRARDGIGPTFAQAEASDDRLALAGVLSALIFIATAVVWVVWQYRAHANLRSLGADDLRYRPGWVVGWWFIPVANTAMPYLTTRELHKASDPDAGAIDWKGRRTWPVLWMWWGAWLLGRFLLASVAFYLAADADAGVERLIASDGFEIAGGILEIGAALLAIAVVRSIDRRQSAKARLLAARAEAPAPAFD